MRLVGYYADKVEIIPNIDDLIFAVNQLPRLGGAMAQRFQGATEALMAVVKMNTNAAMYLTSLREIALAADVFDEEERERLKARRIEEGRAAQDFDMQAYMKRAEERADQRAKQIQEIEERIFGDEARTDEASKEGPTN